MREPRPPRTTCAKDPYGVYGTTYDALVACEDRRALVNDLRLESGCCSIRDDCAIAQAFADVERGIPKRRRAQLLCALLQQQLAQLAR